MGRLTGGDPSLLRRINSAVVLHALRATECATLTEITGYLQAARANLQSGQALIGPDTGGAYDDLAFALPANAGATYCKRKLPAATEAFGDAALVWEAQ